MSESESDWNPPQRSGALAGSGMRASRPSLNGFCKQTGSVWPLLHVRSAVFLWRYIRDVSGWSESAVRKRSVGFCRFRTSEHPEGSESRPRWLQRRVRPAGGRAGCVSASCRLPSVPVCSLSPAASALALSAWEQGVSQPYLINLKKSTCYFDEITYWVLAVAFIDVCERVARSYAL